MPVEQIFFHEGLAYDTRSALQKPGYLQTAKNITFRKDGQQSLRPKFESINPTAIKAVHSIKRFRDILIVGDYKNLRHRDITSFGNFTSLGSLFANAIFSCREYKDFLHIVNGTDNLFLDASANLYNAFIANPSTAPTGAAGAAGNPDGTYALYVSFLITWPNGQQYETGLSPIGTDVTVASEKISWSSIPVSTYAAVSGTTPTIHRKLYRGPGTGGTLGDIYYVAAVSDNTTTTYTDNFTDAQLAAAGASLVDDYDVPPTTPKFLEYHYSRLFMIDTTKPHRLYYSEAPQGDTSTENEVLRPLAFPLNNWIDLRAAGFGRVDPQGLIAWGAYLYIPLKHTWIRKDGNDPDTWNIKKTWGYYGIGAPYTIDYVASLISIIGLSAPMGGIPGLSLFNGTTAQMITDNRFSDLFEDDLNHNSIEQCRGVFDGRYYHLLYPSGTNINPDKHAAFDLSRFPQIRLVYWEDLNSLSMTVYDQGKEVYIGGSDGFARTITGEIETIDVDIKTHELIGEMSLSNREKPLKELKYNLDTGGDDVTLEIYMDGILGKWPDGTTSKTISGTGDAVQYLKNFPLNFTCYRYALRIYGTGLSTFELYGPWDMEFEFKK